MIVFKNLVKSFNGKKILDDISGELKSEKINMIIGPSGTGKSVFFKCILGLIPIDSGKIFFGNDEMSFYDDNIDSKSFRNKIGLLQQKPSLSPDKTVKENIMLYLDILTDLSYSEKERRVNECLEYVGMENFINSYPNELSGGMQKKVGIACSIVHNPKYLFCDEPDSGLDPESSKMIDNLIKTISKKNKITTVIITHNLDSVIGMSDHIIFLYKSKKKWEGTCKSLFASEDTDLNRFLKSSSMFDKYKKAISNNE